ncbi:hypothetical protein [Williamsia serinedens]|uniref:Uncharacterized protein n=1 Tax=Williamsia serinedens TaxID=391736 RepID=A0ABT1H7B9_9NOCA|nr:hypothetical protein [Williamsia serinedens]MCP2163145.1 hypothetical protein [Williamsia serinedens]
MSARKTPAQHTVRVTGVLRNWQWRRYSGNNTCVAQSHRLWPQRRHCLDAARSEARLTGARLVIDGEEVQP